MFACLFVAGGGVEGGGGKWIFKKMFMNVSGYLCLFVCNL